MGGNGKLLEIFGDFWRFLEFRDLKILDFKDLIRQRFTLSSELIEFYI